MGEVEQGKPVIASSGDAVGRITGINHLILFVRDLTEAIHFYRDVLGLKIIKTLPAFQADGEEAIGRNYFFQMGDGSMIGLTEYPSVAEPSPSVFNSSPIDESVGQLWPGKRRPPSNPQKVDHLSFGVESRADLFWFQERLRANGTEVSEVIDFVEASGAQFVMSIYFFDPFGNPLEISTFDLADPAVEDRLKRDLWYADREPPPILFDSTERTP